MSSLVTILALGLVSTLHTLEQQGNLFPSFVNTLSTGIVHNFVGWEPAKGTAKYGTVEQPTDSSPHIYEAFEWG